MPALELTLPETHYRRLQQEAKNRETVVSELVIEAIEAFLDSLLSEEKRYHRLAHKQATWRERMMEPDEIIESRLNELQLDLIYHSEAIEGSLLSKLQIKQAIRDCLPH